MFVQGWSFCQTFYLILCLSGSCYSLCNSKLFPFCLPDCLSVCLPDACLCPCVCLSVLSSVRLSIFCAVCPSCLSVCLLDFNWLIFIHVSVYLSCLSVWLIFRGYFLCSRDDLFLPCSLLSFVCLCTPTLPPVMSVFLSTTHLSVIRLLSYILFIDSR